MNLTCNKTSTFGIRISRHKLKIETQVGKQEAELLYMKGIRLGKRKQRTLLSD